MLAPVLLSIGSLAGFAALSRPSMVPTTRAQPAVMSENEPIDASFRRSSDVLNTGDQVTARQVVNVLGRWKSRTDWNDAGIGRKRLIDDYRTGDYYEEDLPKMATDFNKPMQYYIARRPQFMDFCERYGLVARWVHRENVGTLKFEDTEENRALAASVGATVEELNAEPVEELAADVVFDALSQTGMVGFAEEEEVDRQRASFIGGDGSFNADAFGKSLVRSRVNSAAALSGVRVIPPSIMVGIGYHYLPQIIQMKDEIETQFKMNMDTHPWTILVPIVTLGPFIYKAMTFVPAMERPMGAGMDGLPASRTLNYQERAILARDEFYKERMRRKKSGQLTDKEKEVTPILNAELFADESYLQKMLRYPHNSGACTQSTGNAN